MLRQFQDILSNAGDISGFQEKFSQKVKLRRNIQYKHFASEDFNPEWLNQDTKKVFFDIESISLDEEITGYQQGFGIAVSIDEGGAVRYWKREEMPQLVDYLLSFDEVVTYHGLTYDNAVIALELKDDERMQALYNKSFDLVPYITIISPAWSESVGLSEVAEKTVNDTKLNNGIEGKGIPGILRSGSPEMVRKVWEYCLQDVVLTMKVYKYYEVSEEKKLEILRSLISRTLELVFNELLGLANEMIHYSIPREDVVEKIDSLGKVGEVMTSVVSLMNTRSLEIVQLESYRDFISVIEQIKDDSEAYVRDYDSVDEADYFG